MSMNVNKARSTGVVSTDPVSRIQRIQFNHDFAAAIAEIPEIPAVGETPAVPAVPAVPESPATITVLVDFFESQAALDSGDSPFDTRSYQVNEPMAMEALLNTELKTLADFDAAV